jgi:hypothetical protein
MSGMKQSSPAPNPGTPNTRVSANDKFLERIRSIKAIVKAISTDSPPDDQNLMLILDVFKDTFNNMLLNADPHSIVAGLVQKVGERLAPLAAAGGAPVVAGPPVQVQAPQNPGAPPAPGAPPMGQPPMPQMGA